MSHPESAARLAFAGMLAGALCGGNALAGDLAGSSTLLDKSTHAQLERWLGAGQFNLNNVYTRKAGDTSLAFHAAADNKGASFVLLDVTNTAGASYLVGGYNPQSWSSTDGWHLTPDDAARTAFLFNLTAPAVYRQVLTDYILPSQGLRQTFNGPDYGPTFGQGHDLYVNPALDMALSWQITYGNPADAGKSIVDRSTGGQVLHVNALEVFTMSPVPEPAAWAMLLGGLGVLALRTRRRNG